MPVRIKKGDRGRAVVDVQRRLSMLGFDLGPAVVDGAYEENTAAAVKSFQRRYRLPISGEVDSATWHALVDATFRLGDRALYLKYPFLHGNDVLQLQRWLRSLGFHRGRVDGIFGPVSEGSVRDFQLNVGVFPDGIVGIRTVAALLRLNKILPRKSEAAFAGTGDTSFVSGLKDKKITLRCNELQAHLPWLDEHKKYELHLELAFRLYNLLELLGAAVGAQGLEDKVEAENEIVLDFAPGRDNDSIKIGIYDNERSTMLASFITSEVSLSLKNRLKSLESRLKPAPLQSLPWLVVQIGRLSVLETGDDLERDVIKQKIAAAFFDGIKKYFTVAAGG